MYGAETSGERLVDLTAPLMEDVALELLKEGLAGGPPPGVEEETAVPEIAEVEGNGSEPEVVEPVKKPKARGKKA